MSNNPKSNGLSSRQIVNQFGNIHKGKQLHALVGDNKRKPKENLELVATMTGEELQIEKNLILQKKSKLSKFQREYVMVVTDGKDPI